MDSIRMCDLAPGRTGVVLSMGNTGAVKRRLLDLGLVKGSRVKCLGKSLWGDPAAYEICGAVIALRSADCSQILLREVCE